MVSDLAVKSDSISKPTTVLWLIRLAGRDATSVGELFCTCHPEKEGLLDRVILLASKEPADDKHCPNS